MKNHFPMHELTFSMTATRHGWDNTPPPSAAENLERLRVSLLEPLRRHVGPLIVLSGYRCLRLNRHLNSKDSSAHVDGRAADIWSSSYTPKELAQVLTLSTLGFDQVIYEYGRWVHVAIAPLNEKQRMQVLTIDNQGVRVGLHSIRD